ncbi:MAG: hypothetical protein QXV75_08305 [Candidatus Bathyarchaeia archaeon]
MGTRALFRIYDFDGSIICTIYTQFDGYPDGIPLAAMRFLASRELVNGIGDDWFVFNGMDDLAAQLVTYLKVMHGLDLMRFKGMDVPDRAEIEKLIWAGTIYVVSPDTIDAWQDYEYHIKPDGMGGVRIEAYRMGENARPIEAIFSGSPKEYVEKFAAKALAR